MTPPDTDWIDGMTTMLANRDPADLEGVAVHVYACNRDMDRVFVDADGELVFLPQSGRLTILTELGRIDIAPGQIALVPRGVRFRVELPDGEAAGYVAENHGSLFRLPDLGPIGANGLAIRVISRRRSPGSRIATSRPRSYRSFSARSGR